MRPREPAVLTEPRFSVIAASVFGRAARRPLRTLALALLATGLVVGARVLRSPIYVATVAFRLSEGDLHDPAHAPRPPPAVRQSIADVALNRERLLAIMKGRGMIRSGGAGNPAVASVREDITISVIRNYFVLDRREADEPRSAGILISFRSPDRELARGLVHDIAAVIIQTQTAARAAALRAAQHLAQAEARRADQLLQAMELQRARAAGRLRESDEPGASVLAEAAALEREVALSRARSARIARRAAGMQFASAAEERRLWFDLKLVDESLTTIRKPLTVEELAGYALAVFAVTLLVSAAFVGAFDGRVYGAADVAAAGGAILGTVPRFAGDGAHLHRVRLRSTRRHEEATT